MGKEYNTLDTVDNFLTLDEFVKEVKRIAEEEGVDIENIRLAGFDDMIVVEEEFEL
jgi:hypothetical protein